MPRRRTGERQQQLSKAVELMESGFDQTIAAKAVGIHRTTVKRWLGHHERGEALARRRGPILEEVLPNVRWRAESLVRELRGLVGAESLRRSVPGLTRREAARIKGATLREMEEERRAAAARVHLTAPGVLRGFDAMDLGETYLLVAGDGSIPYRTSWSLVGRYDSAAVQELLEKDFDLWGAPLVMRLDRARQHQTEELRALLAEHEVLILHGPPYLARYYGQLERQNREHRAWLQAGVGDDPRQGVERMIRALNSQWRRSTLSWKTAAEVWEARGPIHVDRSAFRDEVAEQTHRIRRHLEGQKNCDQLAPRLAIEQVLVRHGLLWIETGGWAAGIRGTALEVGGLLTLPLSGKALDGFEVQQEKTRPQLSHRAWKPGSTDAGFPQRQQAGSAPTRTRCSVSRSRKRSKQKGDSSDGGGC